MKLKRANDEALSVLCHSIIIATCVIPVDRGSINQVQPLPTAVNVVEFEQCIARMKLLNF